ncbi:hypothetical protein D9619_006832 [Psilocybe cf. subviscida]|uniref:Uncharacterized protein n=1 Tax=Psilocybe cf. subviscida TaxID=2480587 RepID=A0A8H5EXV0_9AGAR|nr:hypothetical protein D9619_006832 [Psilocybe cf. subviscida]
MPGDDTFEDIEDLRNTLCSWLQKIETVFQNLPFPEADAKTIGAVKRIIQQQTDRSWGKEFKLLMHAGDQAEAMYHIVTSSLFTCIRYGDAAVSEMMLPVLGEATEAVKLSLKALMVRLTDLILEYQQRETARPRKISLVKTVGAKLRDKKHKQVKEELKTLLVGLEEAIVDFRNLYRDATESYRPFF